MGIPAGFADASVPRSGSRLQPAQPAKPWISFLKKKGNLQIWPLLGKALPGKQHIFHIFPRKNNPPQRISQHQTQRTSQRPSVSCVGFPKLSNLLLLPSSRARRNDRAPPGVWETSKGIDYRLSSFFSENKLMAVFLRFFCSILDSYSFLASLVLVYAIFCF